MHTDLLNPAKETFPAHGAKTGEVFVMRSPDPSMLHVSGHTETMPAWKKLRETIERCGGTVRSIPAYPWIRDRIGNIHAEDERSAMYTRDCLLPVIDKNEKTRLLLPRAQWNELSYEAEEMIACLPSEDKAELTLMAGQLEGGNFIPDRSRGILFVGISNTYQAKFNNPALSTKQTFNNRLRNAWPHANGLAALRHHVGQETRVVPLFIPDQEAQQFYHLDGAFNILPDGHALVCRAVLSSAAWHLIERFIGREKIIEITRAQAELGATNFITVGHHLITPHAPPRLRQQLTQLGYEVITPPDVGLPANAWRFCAGAGPRCVTLKLTMDKEYPVAKQSTMHHKGRET